MACYFFNIDVFSLFFAAEFLFAYVFHQLLCRKMLVGLPHGREVAPRSPFAFAWIRVAATCFFAAVYSLLLSLRNLHFLDPQERHSLHA